MNNASCVLMEIFKQFVFINVKFTVNKVVFRVMQSQS